MMRIFLAFFISFACAAEFQEPKGRNIEKASISGFDQLDSDIFYCIVTFLSAEEVFNLKFLSKRVYNRVKKLWPKMKLSTIIEGSLLGRPVDFSHKIKIRGVNLKNQKFPYSRAQLSCLREFLFSYSGIPNLQTVIDLLPRDSLTSLKLHNFELPYSLINKIDFPKLTCLKLSWNISPGHDTFSFLPSCMRVLAMIHMNLNDITSYSLALALKTMNRLDILSLAFCTLSKNGISAILENLPTSLRTLELRCIKLLGFNMKLSDPGLKRLKEMKCLGKIDFLGVSDEFALEIIMNLPKCITNIRFYIDREALSVFQRRLGEFTNVKEINLCYMTDVELYPVIREIFPNLDDIIKKELDKYGSMAF